MSFIDDYTNLDEQGNVGTRQAMLELNGIKPQPLDTHY